MPEIKETFARKRKRRNEVMLAFMEDGALLAPMSGAEMVRLRIDIGTALGVYITQEDLGVFINRGVSNVNKFEGGKRPIPQSIGTLLRLVHRVAHSSRAITATGADPPRTRPPLHLIHHNQQPS